jgi:hypothetical protein
MLVRHAGYDINHELVLCIFTSALPNAMYDFILRNVCPVSYKQWRVAAIEQQRHYIHMKNWVNQYKGKGTKTTPTPGNWRPPNKWHTPTNDPNTMDTSPGRTRARIAEAEDFLPGGSRYEQRFGGNKQGGLPRGPVQKDGTRKVLKCFFCDKPGHFARDCRMKRYGPQGPVCTRKIEEEEDNNNTATAR